MLLALWLEISIQYVLSVEDQGLYGGQDERRERGRESENKQENETEGERERERGEITVMVRIMQGVIIH